MQFLWNAVFIFIEIDIVTIELFFNMFNMFNGQNSMKFMAIYTQDVLPFAIKIFIRSFKAFLH